VLADRPAPMDGMIKIPKAQPISQQQQSLDVVGSTRRLEEDKSPGEFSFVFIAFLVPQQMGRG
jgi:hypothetical protein